MILPFSLKYGNNYPPVYRKTGFMLSGREDVEYGRGVRERETSTDTGSVHPSLGAERRERKEMGGSLRQVREG